MPPISLIILNCSSVRLRFALQTALEFECVHANVQILGKIEASRLVKNDFLTLIINGEVRVERACENNGRFFRLERGFRGQGHFQLAVKTFKVNGIVTIYGCWYREGKDKTGKDYQMVSFPSQKGKDGKYYNHAYLKLQQSDVDFISKEIEKLL